MDLELFNLEPDFGQFVHSAGHVEGVGHVVKSLLDLALNKSTAAFADGSAPPSRVETKLKPDVALAYYNKLPLPNCMNAGTHATFIDNEDYWKRACNSKSCSNHEHGYNYKRMYLELNLLEILLAGDDIDDFNPNDVVNRLMPISEYIYTLRLQFIKQQLPLDIVCSNLLNLSSIILKQSTGLNGILAKAIASSPNLVSLAVTESQITDDIIGLLVKSLSALNVLLLLDLSNNMITAKGAKFIADELIAPKKSILCSVDLSGNKLSSDGCAAIGQALVSNESLISLILRLNNIGDSGAMVLFESLRVNKTLEHLNLSANNLCSATFLLQVLKEKWGGCHPLDTIIMTSNSFNEDELIRLGEWKTPPIDARTRKSSEKKS
jgi:hypothetical protein